MNKKLGHYAFIIGVLIAVMLGIVQLGVATPWLSSLLVVLGLIVGLLNVTGKETKEFLLVTVVLIIATSMGGAATTLGGIQYIGKYLNTIFTQMLVFIVPAVIVVALKDIWNLEERR